MTHNDTIAAIASAIAPSPRLIVRLSGPQSHPLTTQLTTPPSPSPGTPGEGRGEGDVELQKSLHSTSHPTTLHLPIGPIPITLYTFRAPHSYTGEDCVEFHLPGNPLLANLLLAALLKRGARLANPGEFTARAYFNGKMDLAEAEGVAAAIGAQNQSELAAAQQLLAGELAHRIRPIMTDIAETLALLEVGIDFSEEDVTFLSPDQLKQRLHSADAALQKLLSESHRFERLSHEPTVVLVGRPNAGKSTLLNALAGQQRAVVSPIAGTTRDALSAHVVLPHGLIRLIDVAGIDDSPAAHVDIDRQMQQQAHRAAQQADLLLLVHDIQDIQPPLALPRPPDLTVLTKSDLRPSVVHPLAISAQTGAGLAELRKQLDLRLFGQPASATLALNTRHVAAIEETRRSLAAALQKSHEPAEVIAVDLRDALDALGLIVGALSPDEVLDHVFKKFCIGK